MIRFDLRTRLRRRSLRPPLSAQPRSGQAHPRSRRRRQTTRRRGHHRLRSRLESAAARQRQREAGGHRSRHRALHRLDHRRKDVRQLADRQCAGHVSRSTASSRVGAKACQLMVVGEKRRFWIPQTLAYNGMPGRPAGMLVFDVELLAIKPSPSTSASRCGCASRGCQAHRLGSRLQIAQRRTRADNIPTKSSQVTVHYTGWTTDGKMFDTLGRQGPADYFRIGRRHPRVDRGRPADDRRREDALLDPRTPGLQR